VENAPNRFLKVKTLLSTITAFDLYYTTPPPPYVRLSNGVNCRPWLLIFRWFATLNRGAL
jgi:hypothetical protein